MNRYLGNPLILTVIAIVAALLITVIVKEFTKPPSFDDDATVTVRIDRAKVKAKVVASRERQGKGLMGRKSLSDEEGLLFVYNEPVQPRFWMKDVTFPIDIIWISDNTVTEVTHNVKPPAGGVPDIELPRYMPQGPVNRVLEVAGGWATRNSVQTGDPVRYSR